MKKHYLPFLLMTFHLQSWAHGINQVGSFDTPVGQNTAGPAFPGQAYEFEVEVKPGERLNFTSMYGASNDWFFSMKDGVLLGNGKKELTSYVQIFDAGTEVDENRLVATHDAAHQPQPNFGPADPIPYVRCLSMFPDFQTYKFIRVYATHLDDYRYKVKITVNQNSATPLSPGVYWTEQASAMNYRPFMLNQKAMDNGLEAQAEDGDPSKLVEVLQAQ